jgi:hypothetical protein
LIEFTGVADGHSFDLAPPGALWYCPVGRSRANRSVLISPPPGHCGIRGSEPA